MTRRKDERRELLKEDDFHSFLERVARHIQQNGKQVAMLSLGVLAVIAAGFMWDSQYDVKRDKQARELYRAEKILNTDITDEKAELKFASEKEKYEAALVELDKTIESQRGVVKQRAIIRKVGVLVALGRQAEVEDLYKGLMDGNNGLKVFGLMGLGDVYLAEGRYKDARDQFSQLEGLGKKNGLDLADLMRYKLAVCYKGENDLDKAKSELSQLIDAYEGEEDAAKKPPILVKAQAMYDELTKDDKKESDQAS